METIMFNGFLLGVIATLSSLLVIAMMAFGPQILELIEGE